MAKPKPTAGANPILALMPSTTRKLLSSTGSEFLEQVGDALVREVLYNVLCGRNLRDYTEPLTRERLGLLNSATLVMFVRGCAAIDGFAAQLPTIAAKGLQLRLDKYSRWILQWILGLTDKARQNVLRDRKEAIAEYADKLAATNLETARAAAEQFGVLSGQLQLSPDEVAVIDWPTVIQLLGTVGAQTLAARGALKSMFGKLFERLILGAVLTILGFRQVSRSSLRDADNVFWLSSKDEGKREADATALCGPGRGVRFDIGFIGRGNSEISLDKLSRFAKIAELGGNKRYMATFVITDRVGLRSQIQIRAREIEATFIQMSGSYWPHQLALELRRQVGFESELASMPETDVDKFFKVALSKLPLRPFIEGVKIEADPRNTSTTPLE